MAGRDWCILTIRCAENHPHDTSVVRAMNVRQRIALLLATLILAALAGCTEPSGGSGPGATTQPAASSKGDY